MKTFKTKNSVNISLGKNEELISYPCPKCGGQLVVNYGAGISCTFCVDCNDYSDYDYDM